MDELSERDTQLQCEAHELWGELIKHFSYFANFDHPKLHRESLNYLRYGAAKRIFTIFHDIRWLTLNIPAKRKTNLNAEECRIASLHLNSIYLHIRGSLDNFAWAILWQLAPDEAEKFDKNGDYQRVGLFKNSVLGKLNGTKLKTLIEECKAWDEDFKSRRDPVAHRLPLQVIPQILAGDEDRQRYQELQNKISENISEYALKALQESKKPIGDSFEDLIQKNKKTDELIKENESKNNYLYKQLFSLGIFIPCFAFSKNDSPIYLYPTITDDCNQLIKIADEVAILIETRLNQ